MFAAILSLFLCGAPVPTHLMKPAPDPIVPGFRWWFARYELEVMWVEGETVWYYCRNHPAMTWPSTIPELTESNVQTKERVRDEVRMHPQRGNPPIP